MSSLRRATGLVSRLASGAMGSAAASVIGMATGFLTVALVAHVRGAGTTGVLFGAIGLFTIVATSAKLGTETSFVYFLGSARGRVDGTATAPWVGALLRLALVPVVVVSTLAAVILFLGADLWARWLIDAEHEAAYASTLRVLAPAIPVWAVTLPLLGVTRGHGNMVPTSLGLQAGQPALQLVLVSLALVLDLDIRWLAAAWTAPLLITLVVAVLAVRAAHDTADPGDPLTIAPGDFWRHAGPRGLAGTLTMAVDRLGVVLVAGLGSAELAGAWVAITRLVGMCLRVVHVLGQKLNTTLPKLLGAGRPRHAARAVRSATQLTVVLLTAPLVTLLIVPDVALRLFDVHEVSGATSALRIVVGAAAVIVLLAHVDNVLLMSGRSVLAMMDSLAGLVALVGLTIVLLPRHGLPGAALAWLVSAAVARGLAWLQARRTLGEGPVDLTNLLTFAAVASFGLVVGWGLVGLFGRSLVVAAVVAGTTFAVAIGANRLLGRSDRESIAEATPERTPADA